MLAGEVANSWRTERWESLRPLTPTGRVGCPVRTIAATIRPSCPAWSNQDVIAHHIHFLGAASGEPEIAATGYQMRRAIAGRRARFEADDALDWRMRRSANVLPVS